MNIRIKLLRDFGPYNEGQVVRLAKGQAELLIAKGVAVMTKEMTKQDMKHG